MRLFSNVSRLVSSLGNVSQQESSSGYDDSWCWILQSLGFFLQVEL